MWNITQDPLYQNALSTEIEKRWSRISNRVADLNNFFRNPDKSYPYTMEQLFSFWMKKGNGMVELREVIRKSDNPAVGVEAYVNVLLDHWDKPEKILDSLNRYENRIVIPGDCFANKPYAFLNALFAAFPEIVLKTPGLMQKDWADKAMLPENTARTAIGLMGAYQSAFVFKNVSIYDNDYQQLEEFERNFKSAFGEHPVHLAMRLPEPDSDNYKEILRFFKRSCAKTTNLDFNIPTSYCYRRAQGGWIRGVLKSTGLAADRACVDLALKYRGPYPRQEILDLYIAQHAAPLKKLGRLFEAKDVTNAHIQRLIALDEDSSLQCLREFLSGFGADDQKTIFDATHFPVEATKSSALKRHAISSDLDI